MPWTVAAVAVVVAAGVGLGAALTAHTAVDGVATATSSSVKAVAADDSGACPVFAVYGYKAQQAGVDFSSSIKKLQPYPVKFYDDPRVATILAAYNRDGNAALKQLETMTASMPKTPKVVAIDTYRQQQKILIDQYTAHVNPDLIDPASSNAAFHSAQRACGLPVS